VDTSTLVMSYMVLREGSVRSVARKLNRPVSTVSDAISRLEQVLAIPLVSRSNGVLVKSLVADGVADAIGEMVASLRELIAIVDDGPAASNDMSGEPDMAVIDWLVAHSVSCSVLERFVEIIRVGSIRRAAGELHIGQPQLSRQIAHLEAVLGQALLSRHTGGCLPTVAGEAVYGFAVTFNERWRALISPANGRFSRRVKTVHFATIIPISHETRVAKLLANIVANWSLKRTQHHLFMSCMTSQALMDGMRGKQFDVGLLETPCLDPAFEERPILSSDLAIIGPTGFASAIYDGSLSARFPLAVPSLQSGLRPLANRMMAANGFDHEKWPAGMVEIDSIPIILSLIISHGHVGVFPADAIPKNTEGVEIVVPPNRLPIQFYLLWQPTPLARAAAAEIIGILGGLADGVSDTLESS
jgi:LysR family nitrogen assimilation transcriptional regulator